MMPAIARLEIHGVLRARWFVAASALGFGIAGFFVLLSARESAVVGFTGFGRVMGGVVQASLLFVPMLSMFSTAQAVTGARQQGVLEWYLSYPNGRERCFWSLFLPRVTAVAGPVILSVLVIASLAGRGMSPLLVGSYLTLLAGQGFCFAAVGMLISAASRTPEQALLRALVVWMAAAVLVDFVVLGLMLKWDLSPWAVFALAGANPVQAGRIAILAAVDPEMGVLGPVGTWATVTLGAPATITYGLVWPFVLGAGCLAAARWVFLRRDVV